MDTDISTEREARAAWSMLADPGYRDDHDLLARVGVIEAVAEIVRQRTAQHSFHFVPTVQEIQNEHPDTRVIVPGDDEWPEALEVMPSPPVALWVKGGADIGAALGQSLAVTGARASTTYGEFVAADIGSGVTRAGCTVVSGGAFGIDAAATRGALVDGGAPLIFQAGGVDRPYPAAHAGLMSAVVAQGGAIISEVGPGRAPTRSRFLRRCALLGWICSGTLIVEAGNRSGSLSTAAAAIDALRPLGAVPGPVTSMVSAGTNRLIADQKAYLITDGQEAAGMVQ